MWPLYDDAWWYGIGGGGSALLGIIALIIIFDDLFKESAEKSKENNKQKEHPVEQEKPQHPTYVYKEPPITAQTYEMPRHRVIKCGTPFLEAKRRKEKEQ